MPRMNGFELAERTLVMRPHLPVLLMTGYADTSSLRSSSLPVRILKKPFRVTELGKAVSELLQNAPQRRSN